MKIDKETEELIKKIKQDTIMYVDEEGYSWVIPRFFFLSTT